MPLSITKQSSIPATRAAYYFHLAGKYLQWSNTNYHRKWWVQHILTNSFWFFLNIKIKAEKTRAPSIVTSRITIRKISLYKSNNCPDPVLTQFFSKISIQMQSWSKKIASILQDIQFWSCLCPPLLPKQYTQSPNNQEVAGVTFSNSDSAPLRKFLNLAPDPSPAILQIW